MKSIIETISKKGIQSTSPENYNTRCANPRPGDIVDFGDFEGIYPFTSGKYGTIEFSGESYATNKNEIYVCCGGASVFLMDSGKVSISGGPFEVIPKANIEPTYATKQVNFWNWGNNSPGANQGVHFIIERPIFLLTKFDKES
jgi:hypothetical protein